MDYFSDPALHHFAREDEEEDALKGPSVGDVSPREAR